MSPKEFAPHLADPDQFPIPRRILDDLLSVSARHPACFTSSAGSILVAVIRNGDEDAVRPLLIAAGGKAPLTINSRPTTPTPSTASSSRPRRQTTWIFALSRDDTAACRGRHRCAARADVPPS
jgi:hypothetical protein